MNNQGKVTILIENERGAGCTEEMSNEHGLSMLIEKGDTRILMDTGATGAFFKNAQQLGVSLEGLSAIVFSHNHYDHTGGILTLLENCPDTPIYLRAEAKRRFYRKKDNHFNYHGEPQDTFLSQNTVFILSTRFLLTLKLLRDFLSSTITFTAKIFIAMTVSAFTIRRMAFRFRTISAMNNFSSCVIRTVTPSLLRAATTESSISSIRYALSSHRIPSAMSLAASTLRHTALTKTA